MNIKHEYVNQLFSIVFVAMMMITAANVRPACGVTVDRIAAIVNGDVLTLSEVKDRARPILQKYTKEETSEDQLEAKTQEILAQVLLQLIDEHLVQERVKMLGIKVDEQEIEDALERICEDNYMTEDELAARLASEGYTLEKYKDELGEQIKRTQLINAQVRAKTVITDEQVREYIRERSVKKATDSPRYVLQHICVRAKDPDDPESREATRRQAEAAYNALEDGRNFDEVAIEYSTLSSGRKGGYLGVFALKEMAPFVKQAVINLKLGEFSKIVDSPVGWQIFRLKEILQGGEDEIGSSQMEEIRHKLYREQIDARFEEWLRELRSKSTIRILL